MRKATGEKHVRDSWTAAVPSAVLALRERAWGGDCWLEGHSFLNVFFARRCGWAWLLTLSLLGAGVSLGFS